MNKNQLIKKWHGKTVEDCGGYMSDSAKNFARNFKSYIQTIANEYGAEVVNFNIGHYYFSGFIKFNDKYLYFCRDIERWNSPINLYDSSCMGGILIRTATSDKDYKGGQNYFCNIDTLENQYLMLKKI